ncbi:MAG: FAD-binding oxidoreductase [Planctomycetaceae bacterium]|nr:FAD-binding oxidoreductase [Planctomycetaceae bacterium]
MNWPETAMSGRLGDGRNAIATDRPETVDALRQAVIERVAQGYALYPQGGGTALDYGGVPRTPGVAIDTRALGRIIDYPAADMTITVEAGLTLAGLRTVLAEQGQRLLVDAPHPDRATLGGIFATNTNGPRRFGAGRPRDQIIGISFVTSDGALVKGGGRVVKNVAGYDFPKLLTGSLGTLGIIAQMTLKVRPIPEAAALAWVPFPGVADLGPALERLNTSATRPMALELLNPAGARLAGAPLGLPADRWTLAIGFEDNAASVAWQLDRLKAELGRTDLTILEAAAADPLWSALTELQAAEVGPVSFVANVRLSTVVPLVEDLDPSMWAIQAHAGNGIVRGHALGTPDLDALAPEIERLRARAVRDGGNLILSRCPTDAKGRLRVWGEPRPDWALAERVKRTLDPKGVLNPGRFVGTI